MSVSNDEVLICLLCGSETCSCVDADEPEPDVPRYGPDPEDVLRVLIRRGLLLGLLLLTVSASVAAALPPHPDPLGFTTACTTPSTLTATPSAILSNVVARIRFRCGTAEAFSVTANTNATPVFLLPSGGLSLWIVRHDSADFAECRLYSGAVALSTGTFVLFSSAGTWDYCLQINRPTDGFVIVWSSVLLLQSFPSIGPCSSGGQTVGTEFLLALFVAVGLGILGLFVFLTGGESSDVADHLMSADFIAFALIVTVVAVIAAFLLPSVISSLNSAC